MRTKKSENTNLVNNKENEQGKIRLFALLSLCETVLFAGLPYGWGTLLYVFKEEGIFSDLCENKSQNISSNNLSNNMSYLHLDLDINLNNVNKTIVGCQAQDQRFNLCFAVATCIGTTMNVVIGYLNQRFGTTKTRLIFIPVFVCGALFLAFTSKELPWFTLPGLTLLSSGGFSLLLTNIKVSSFLTVGTAVYLGLLSGSYDSSSVITRALYENGIGIKQSFIGIAVLHTVVSGINTWIHSRFTMQSKEVEIKVKSGIDNKSFVEENDSIINDTRVKGEDKDNELEEQNADGVKTSLKHHLTSSLYLLHLMFMCIMVLKFVFFLGSINKHLENTFSDKKEVGHFTDTMAYTLMFGIVGSFMSGSLLEWQKKVFSDRESEYHRKLFPQILPLSICGILVISLSALSFMSSTNTFYVLFVNLVLLRSFIYAVNMGYITNMFPPQHTGILFGLIITISGIVGLFQYVLFIWMDAYDNALNHVNMMLCGLGILSLTHPINVFLKARRAIT